MKNKELVLLVLSCDGYSDLWDDFFNIRDLNWSDCPYKWYLVTESKDYVRTGVEVIKCGKEMNWAARFRHAVKLIDADYYGIYLEDYFIDTKVDNTIIKDLIDTMVENKVTYINTSDVFFNCIKMKNKRYLKEHLIIVPNNKKYGISTESAIWEKNFLLEKIGEGDYSAWKFEDDRVFEATTPEGLGGFLLCDDRQPFHASIRPVVIQGVVYPPARRYFKKMGYNFLTKRENMSWFQVFLYKLKQKFSHLKHGKKQLKWFASKFFGMKFS